MAKSKYSSPGRNAQTRAKPEADLTREEQVKHMVALGFTDVAMWSALEGQFPQIIKDPDERRRKSGSDIPFDAKMFKAIGEQLRSVKGLAIKEQEMLDGMIAPSSSRVKSIDETEFRNRKRWRCGWEALDYIFGETRYVHPDDAPNSKYKDETFEYFDAKKGKMVKTQVKVWIKGDWKSGDPLCLDSKGKIIFPRNKDGTLVGEDVRKLQKVEKGLPEGYFGFVGGQAGVGKSRAMIELTHAVNKAGRLVHYYNGEADPSDFRSWCGASVNAQLFRVFHATDDEELVPMSVIEQSAKAEMPSLIIIDSFQLIAEAAKGYAGQRRALARLKALKSSDEAGRPTIIIISQLNKKQELAGHKFLEHMVDYSIKVYRRQGHKNQFYMDSMKMRGAECPRNRLFKHTYDGVICLNSEYGATGEYDLMTPAVAMPPAVQQGIVLPQPAKPSQTSPVTQVSNNAGEDLPAPELIAGDAGDE